MGLENCIDGIEDWFLIIYHCTNHPTQMSCRTLSDLKILVQRFNTFKKRFQTRMELMQLNVECLSKAADQIRTRQMIIPRNVSFRSVQSSYLIPL